MEQQPKAAANQKVKSSEEHERETGQHVGYRYDVNLLPDYSRLTPFLKRYLEMMGWDDLNWLEDVHLGYEEGRAAIFDRNLNGWVTVPDSIVLPDNQQDRDMLARELLIKFQMSKRNPLVALKDMYEKHATVEQSETEISPKRRPRAG